MDVEYQNQGEHGPFDVHDESTIGLTDAKLQHYTPRFILGKFVDEEGNLRVRDADSGDEYRARPRRVAAETSYYDIPIEIDFEVAELLRAEGVASARISSEPWFGMVETEASAIVERLVASPDDIQTLSRLDQHLLARFFVAQYFRTPAYRKKRDDLMRRMFDGVQELAKGIAPGADLERLNPKPTDATAVADILRGAHGWANLFRTMDWRIGVVPNTHPLNTSDNMMSERIPPVRYYYDLLNISGFEYWIPLSPEVLLVLNPIILDHQSQETGDRLGKISANGRLD